jgi:hypothetical protein
LRPMIRHEDKVLLPASVPFCSGWSASRRANLQQLMQLARYGHT